MLSAEEFITSTVNIGTINERPNCALEGPAISTGGHRMGFTTRESNHDKCGRVYVSTNRSYWVQRSLYHQLQLLGRKKSQSNQTQIVYKIIKSISNREEKPQLSYHYHLNTTQLNRNVNYFNHTDDYLFNVNYTMLTKYRAYFKWYKSLHS